jgi:hypothetical protein
MAGWQPWHDAAPFWVLSVAGGGECGWAAIDYLLRTTTNISPQLTARHLVVQALMSPTFPHWLVASVARRLYEDKTTGNDINYKTYFAMQVKPTITKAMNFVRSHKLDAMDESTSRVMKRGEVSDNEAARLGHFVYTAEAVAKAAPPEEWRALAQLLARLVAPGAKFPGGVVAWFNDAYSWVITESPAFIELDLTLAMLSRMANEKEQKGAAVAASGPLANRINIDVPLERCRRNIIMLVNEQNGHWLAAGILNPNATLQLVLVNRTSKFSSDAVKLVTMADQAPCPLEAKQ